MVRICNSRCARAWMTVIAIMLVTAGASAQGGGQETEAPGGDQAGNCPEYPVYQGEDLLPSEVSAFVWREYSKEYSEDERIAYHRGLISGFITVTMALQLPDGHPLARYARCFERIDAVLWALNTEKFVRMGSCSHTKPGMPTAGLAMAAMMDKCRELEKTK